MNATEVAQDVSAQATRISATIATLQAMKSTKDFFAPADNTITGFTSIKSLSEKLDNDATAKSIPVITQLIASLSNLLYIGVLYEALKNAEANKSAAELDLANATQASVDLNLGNPDVVNAGFELQEIQKKINESTQKINSANEEIDTQSEAAEKALEDVKNSITALEQATEDQKAAEAAEVLKANILANMQKTLDKIKDLKPGLENAFNQATDYALPIANQLAALKQRIAPAQESLSKLASIAEQLSFKVPGNTDVDNAKQLADQKLAAQKNLEQKLNLLIKDHEQAERDRKEILAKLAETNKLVENASNTLAAELESIEAGGVICDEIKHHFNDNFAISLAEQQQSNDEVTNQIKKSLDIAEVELVRLENAHHALIIEVDAIVIDVDAFLVDPNVLAARDAAVKAKQNDVQQQRKVAIRQFGI